MGRTVSRKDRAQGAAGQGQYAAGTFRCQGAGRPWVSLLRAPSLPDAGLRAGPLRPPTLTGLRPRCLCPPPQPPHRARLRHGPPPTRCTSRKSPGAKETSATKEGPVGPFLPLCHSSPVGARPPRSPGCHTRSGGWGAALGRLYLQECEPCGKVTSLHWPDLPPCRVTAGHDRPRRPSNYPRIRPPHSSSWPSYSSQLRRSQGQERRGGPSRRPNAESSAVPASPTSPGRPPSRTSFPRGKRPSRDVVLPWSTRRDQKATPGGEPRTQPEATLGPGQPASASGTPAACSPPPGIPPCPLPRIRLPTCRLTPTPRLCAPPALAPLVEAAAPFCCAAPTVTWCSRITEGRGPWRPVTVGTCSGLPGCRSPRGPVVPAVRRPL